MSAFGDCAWEVPPSLSPGQPSHRSEGSDREEGQEVGTSWEWTELRGEKGTWTGPPAPTAQDPTPRGAGRPRPRRASIAAVGGRDVRHDRGCGDGFLSLCCGSEM